MKIKLIFLIFFLLCITLQGAEVPKIPDDPRGVIWCPLAESFWNDADLITKIVTGEEGYEAPLENHGYETYRSINRNSLIDFLKMFRDEHDDQRDYIELHSHGGDENEPEWLAVEFYSTKAEAELRVGILINTWPEHSQNIEMRIIESQGGRILYCVSVNAVFLSDMVPSLNNAIVFFGACYSSLVGPTDLSLVQSFLNKEVMTAFGWDVAPTTTENAVGGFFIYRHMCGGVVSEDFDKRNKTSQEALNEYRLHYGNHPNRFHLDVYNDKFTKFYNSPRIVGLEVYQGFRLIYQYGFYYGGIFPTYPYEWDYPGDMTGCQRDSIFIGNQPIQVKILFSSLMNPDKITVEITEEQENFSIPVNGYFSGHIFDYDVWEGTCDFSEWMGGEYATVRVDAEDLFEGDLNDKLDIDGDGNSDEFDTNHKFRVALPPRLTSSDPPKVEGGGGQKDGGGGDGGTVDVDIYKEIELVFNKPMDTTSVRESIEIINTDSNTVVIIKEMNWDDEHKQVTIRTKDPIVVNDTTGFAFLTNYEATILGTAEDTSGVTLDGDEDGRPEGSPEDDVIIRFKTREPDFTIKLRPLLSKIKIWQSKTLDVIVENLEENREIEVKLERESTSDPNWSISGVSPDSVIVPKNSISTEAKVSATNNGEPGSININVKGTCYEKEMHASAVIWAYDQSQMYSEPSPPPGGTDENYSISNNNFNSPWLLNPYAKVGLFLSGYTECMGHLLGKYRIPTAIVLDNFEILGAIERDVSDLDILIIPTGGLVPYYNLAPFRFQLDQYVSNGGKIICYTQSHGEVFEALPGSPTGFGWTEDRSCHAYACYLDRWETFLSGQDDVVFDGNMDGYLTQYPDSTEAFLVRIANGYPGFVRYPHGLGEVVLTTGYTDFSYRFGGSFTDELALIRDLVTSDVVVGSIPEYFEDSTISLTAALFYPAYEESVPANRAEIVTYYPNRDTFRTDVVNLTPSMLPGDTQTVALPSLVTPCSLGIYPLIFTLLQETGRFLGEKN
jgi:hypothetical protein